MGHWLLLFDTWTLPCHVGLNFFVHVWPIESVPSQVNDPLCSNMAHFIMEVSQGNGSILFR